MRLQVLLSIVSFCALVISRSHGFSLDQVGSRNEVQQDKLTEQLDSEGQYILSWTINESNQEITFEIWANTTGYVGLGISPNGEMTGADIFLVGVDSNQQSYSGDYHGTMNGQPVLDQQNDWHLESATENGTHTYARVRRLLNTCDDQDYPITEANTARVIYALGATDTITYHGANRGTKSVNLIAVPEPEFNIGNVSKWDVIVETQMPAADTTYWCSIHKGPTLNKKHHVIGFDVFLDGPIALKHSHHFIVTQCHAPPGRNATELFGPFVGHPGEECYVSEIIPSRYCKKYLFVWAVGGKRTLFPLDIGYAIGESEEDSYYMLEAHYDNPDELEGRRFRSGLEIYYTDVIRTHEARMLSVGYDTIQSMIVPPNQTDYVIAGHCSPECSQHLPQSGLHVFNVLLHSHLSGRKLKLRHFRGEVELPWLSHDDTYDFDFQQNKPLRSQITIMPGDHLIYECVYDSAWNNGSVVLGGLSSREEMCLAFLWVYSDNNEILPFDICGSINEFDDVFPYFGITNITAEGANNDFIITEPQEYNGTRFEDFLNHNFSWTPQFIQQQQQRHRFGNQGGFCSDRAGDFGVFGNITYPNVESFQPDDVCAPGSAMMATATKAGVLASVLIAAMLQLV